MQYPIVEQEYMRPFYLAGAAGVLLMACTPDVSTKPAIDILKGSEYCVAVAANEHIQSCKDTLNETADFRANRELTGHDKTVIYQAEVTAWSTLASHYASQGQEEMACRATESAKEIGDAQLQNLNLYANDLTLKKSAEAHRRLMGTIDNLVAMCRGKFGSQAPLTVSDL